MKFYRGLVNIGKEPVVMQVQRVQRGGGKCRGEEE